MIERTYRYRLTAVTTVDYGDGPSAGKTHEGLLAIIPDGSHWQERPGTISIGVEPARRPGAVFEVSIRELEPSPAYER